MAYRILAGESLDEALRRIAAEQLESALRDIDDGAVDLHAAVHEVRKRCKRIRGLIRLFRPAFASYSAENAGFRDTARQLSDLRDAAVLVAACDALSERFPEELEGRPWADFRERLVERRDGVLHSQADDRIASVRNALGEARTRLADWSLEASGFEAMAGGWQTVYRRARGGWRRARRDPSDESLHEWRKQVAYHRYQLQLLQGSWPAVLGPHYESAKILSERLGQDHDLVVLRPVVIGESGGVDVATRDLVLGLIERRRRELQARSFPVAQRLLDEKPDRAKRRMRRIWEAWRAEQSLASARPHRPRSVSRKPARRTGNA